MTGHNPFGKQLSAFEGHASVATKYKDRIAPNGKSIPIVMAGGDVWFSQASLARLFSKTKQNVSLHLQDICDRVLLPSNLESPRARVSLPFPPEDSIP